MYRCSEFIIGRIYLFLLNISASSNSETTQFCHVGLQDLSRDRSRAQRLTVDGVDHGNDAIKELVV